MTLHFMNPGRLSSAALMLSGAAAVRVAARPVDRPSETASYWVYLGLEVACGTAALASAITRRRGPKRA